MKDLVKTLKDDAGVSSFEFCIKGTINRASGEVYFKISLATIQVLPIVWLLVKLKLIVIPYIL
jgi:hypothetical protein